MRLTANFDASEFDVSEPWPPQFANQREQLALLAQAIRDIAGTPGRITSAYRTADHNAEVGGVPTSQHMRAEAIDALWVLTSLRAIARGILDAIARGVFPAFGQIIFYNDKGHIHVSLPTMGVRNGEVRYSYCTTPGDERTRTYPLLTLANVENVAAVSGAQVAAAEGTGFVFALLLALVFVR